MQRKIKDLLRGGGLDGPLVGIEVEVEGDNLPTQVKGWNCTADGSLRGENVEYVLAVPSVIEEVENCLKHLNLAFLRKKSKVRDTGYAGIHVHVNVGDLTWRQLVRFVSFYYVIEPLLMEWAGEDRVDNLFCLPISAADYPLICFQHFLNLADPVALATDDIRYSALNFKALPQYGSIEFRALRSTLDRGVILNWAKVLLKLREKALEERPLSWIMEQLSSQREALLTELLGEELAAHFKDFKDVGIRMLESGRIVQHLLFTLREDVIDKTWESRVAKQKRVEGVPPQGFAEFVVQQQAARLRPARLDPEDRPRQVVEQPRQMQDEPEFDF